MITKMKKKQLKYHSIDQAKLKILCDDLCDNISDLLDHFGLEYRMGQKMLSMSCPIHGGDNSSALNLYTQGDSYRGNWKCRTHGCEKVFKGSIIGFVRGILSNQKLNWSKDGDDVCSFTETIEFVTSFLKKDIKDIKISRVAKNKQQFTSAVSNISKSNHSINHSYTSRESVRKNLIIPATYYMDRGFSANILNKYDVGLCNKPNKEMSNRVVAPIYDDNHEYMVGCTGRSIFDKCSLCSSFHNPSHECPEDNQKFLFSKWKHSLNFKSQNFLYNFWFAKDHIKKSHCAIVVESPGNVWRLEEAGLHNSVAMFGSSLSDRQKMILDSSGAMSIIVLTDNDEAGKKAAKQIQEKCENTYRIFIPSISKPDIADMSIEEIDHEIKQYIERVV